MDATGRATESRRCGACPHDRGISMRETQDTIPVSIVLLLCKNDHTLCLQTFVLNTAHHNDPHYCILHYVPRLFVTAVALRLPRSRLPRRLRHDAARPCAPPTSHTRRRASLLTWLYRARSSTRPRTSSRPRRCLLDFRYRLAGISGRFRTFPLRSSLFTIFILVKRRTGDGSCSSRARSSRGLAFTYAILSGCRGYIVFALRFKHLVFRDGLGRVRLLVAERSRHFRCGKRLG